MVEPLALCDDPAPPLQIDWIAARPLTVRSSAFLEHAERAAGTVILTITVGLIVAKFLGLLLLSRAALKLLGFVP